MQGPPHHNSDAPCRHVNCAHAVTSITCLNVMRRAQIIPLGDAAKTLFELEAKP